MLSAVVIIPTKNRPAGVRAAVLSARAALPEGRVLVVDDASEPPAAAALADLLSDRVEVVVNPGPAHGPAAARNFGVARSAEDIIFFLDDDDEFLPGYPVGVLTALAGRGAQAAYGFSAVERNGRVSGKPMATGLVPASAPLVWRLAGLGMGAWFRRRAFMDAGGIDETLLVNEDTEFFLRLARSGQNAWYAATPGVRLAPGDSPDGEAPSITTSTTARRRAEAFELMLERYEPYLGTHPRVRRDFVRRIMKYRIRCGESEAARAAIAHESSWLHRLALMMEFLALRLIGPNRRNSGK